jgi:Divergent InlB B-repeat domain
VRSHARASSAGSSTGQAFGLGRVVRGAFVTHGGSLSAYGRGAPSRRLLIALFGATCALAALTPQASAAPPTHPELPTLNQTGFERACGLAVDSQGNRYVADYGTDEVKVFSPSGTAVTSFAPSANAEAPCGLAVDSQGNVYVNGRNTDVVKYKPEGGFPPTSSTTYVPDTSVVSGTGFIAEQAQGVAVDPATGHVYVASPGYIASYQADGTPISTSMGEEEVTGSFSNYSGVAVRGSTGKIYATTRASSAKAYVFSPDGSKVLAEAIGSATKAGGFSSNTYIGMALDQSNGHFYVADVNHQVIDEFDSGGELVSEISTPPALEGTNPSAVAVDSSGSVNAGDVFASAGQSPSSVLAFGPLTYAEFFKLKVTKTGAGHGTVTSSPVGLDCGSTCQVAFEEGSEVTLSAVPEAGSKFASWKGCDTVVGSECKVTLSAQRQVSVKFTARPAIQTEDVHPLDTSALLEATINPNGEETSYQFEFLSEDAYQANGESFAGPEEPLETPASPEPIGAGDGGVDVSAQLLGLTPNTPYRFRVVATNVVGASTGEAVAFRTYLPPQVFKPCANDTFRDGQPSGALPDCRAYEQASPVDKNGGDLLGDITNVKASVNGDRVSFAATAPIPGGEGSQTFTPLYLASRSAEGWSTQGLLPPQSEGRRGRVTGWSPDFSHVFAWAKTLGSTQEVTFLDRSIDARAVSTVFPHTYGAGEPAFVGSSDDGSVVFFEATGAPLAAGAETDKPSLYAWDRASGTVRLAGVFNDESAPPAGSFGGSYDWIGRSSASVGAEEGGAGSAYYTPDQHAAFSDGSGVYFTAAKTGQLYLRLNPSKPQSEVATNGDGEEECTQPALACTIHVSASEKDNSPTGFEGADPAGPHPAAFLGASSDGEHAFFTSSEMLTNDANTGPEQPPAQIGRAKLHGEAPASDLKENFLPTHALGLAIDPAGEHVYWANPSTGTIGRAKLNDENGEPEAPIEPEYIVPGKTENETYVGEYPNRLHIKQKGSSIPRYVAVDEHYVYWTNTGPLGNNIQGLQNGHQPIEGGGTIGRAEINPSTGKATNVESEFITGASNPQGIAVNESHIYWANNEGIGTALIGGEEPEQEYGRIYQREVSGLAIDAHYIYVGTHHEDGACCSSSSVDRFPLEAEGTGPVESDASLGVGDQARAHGVVVDGAYIYWTAQAERLIGRMPTADISGFMGCETTPICEPEFIKTAGSPFGLAASGEQIYFSVNGETPANPGRDLYRYSAQPDSDGHHLTDLSPDPTDPNGAEVFGLLGASEDGSYVYFVANGVLASGASPGTCQGTPEAGSGSCNMYLYHDGQVSFVAGLDIDGHGYENLRMKADTGSSQQKASRVSADGRTLLLRSTSKLTAYENAGRQEFYRYHVGDPNPVCVSCNPTGLPPSGGAPTLGSVQPSGISSFSPTPVLSRNLSADGNRVFFETPETLVVDDTNGEAGCAGASNGGSACQDVYEWEAKGTGSCESEAQNGGCLYLISSGTSTDASYFIDASASGNDAFFFTRSRLVEGDGDTFRDVYDARVGGGLAAQNEPRSAVPCEGDACRQGTTSPPPPASPATSLFSGPGNPKPHHRKAKLKKKRHHRHKRHAKKQGRAHR